jgi:hypothetical protein
MPSEELIDFSVVKESFDGLAVTNLAQYQKEHSQGVLKLLLEAFRQGPSFVWYFRGTHHVHVESQMANTPDVKLNSSQNSGG